jgi:hypothetical protein
MVLQRAQFCDGHSVAHTVSQEGVTRETRSGLVYALENGGSLEEVFGSAKGHSLSQLHGVYSA